MLRDTNLVPLSRQHQHALALCVRIDRASPVANSDLAAWQAEIAEHFRAEIRTHFAAEEQVVFPAVRTFSELNLLIEDLLSDHTWLRARFAAAEARKLSAQELATFGRRLSDHIRKEERQLFERLQELLPKDELAVLGSKLEEALKDAEDKCILPADATRLKPAK
jgi:hemerythrin-like domain-containing protein